MRSMKKTLILLLFIFAFFIPVYSQEYSWIFLRSYAQSNVVAWDINPLEELIISSQSSLYKLDTNFQVTFTQSKKEFGEITKIDARHSLKTLLFSENQQMLVFVDNTLSFQEGKIDLAELNIAYATNICYSDQTGRFWVYDEQNSRLVRFEGIQSSVKSSEITNLRGITLQNFPTSIVENNNQLFLFYKGTGAFVFDYYGSLLRKFNSSSALQIYPMEKYLYLLQPKELVRVDRITGAEETIQLPYQGIEDFRVFGNTVYFKDKNGVKKYSLIQAQ